MSVVQAIEHEHAIGFQTSNELGRGERGESVAPSCCRPSDWSRNRRICCLEHRTNWLIRDLARLDQAVWSCILSLAVCACTVPCLLAIASWIPIGWDFWRLWPLTVSGEFSQEAADIFFLYCFAVALHPQGPFHSHTSLCQSIKPVTLLTLLEHIDIITHCISESFGR
jgi:hypothetical protein